MESIALWVLLVLLGGALTIIPVVARLGRGRDALLVGAALLLVDLVMVAGTIWVARGRGA